MYPTQDTLKLSIELQKSYKLTDYEALKLSIELKRNELFARANVIDGKPEKVALEYIGMALTDIANK